MENLNFEELEEEELFNVQGGAWLADLVEEMMCSCFWELEQRPSQRKLYAG